jgi:hypothetical protein
MEKIAVSKNILIGLGAGFVLALLALAFYIGRESTRRDANPASVQEGAAATPSAARSGTASGMIEPSNAQVTLHPPPVPSTGVSQNPAAPGDPIRAAVVAYFRTIDQIQPGQMSGDASSMANQIVGSLSKGDTSGLDGMIQQTESARRQLFSLAPPEPCAHYHRESLASLDDGLEILHSMKKAVESSDANALSSLTDKGNAMRSRSEALASEEKAIRQRYGLLR